MCARARVCARVCVCALLAPPPLLPHSPPLTLSYSGLSPAIPLLSLLPFYPLSAREGEGGRGGALRLQHGQTLSLSRARALSGGRQVRVGPQDRHVPHLLRPAHGLFHDFCGTRGGWELRGGGWREPQTKTVARHGPGRDSDEKAKRLARTRARPTRICRRLVWPKCCICSNAPSGGLVDFATHVRSRAAEASTRSRPPTSASSFDLISVFV